MNPPAHIGNPHGYPDWTVPMIWVLQDGELWPIEQWVAKQGVQKSWSIGASIAGLGSTDTDLYTVPAGKVFYLVRFRFSSEKKGGFVLRNYNPDFIHFLIHVAGYVGDAYTFAPPEVIAAGKTVRIRMENHDAASGYFASGAAGYELDS
jgi:hypothetical protein